MVKRLECLTFGMLLTSDCIVCFYWMNVCFDLIRLSWTVSVKTVSVKTGQLSIWETRHVFRMFRVEDVHGVCLLPSLKRTEHLKINNWKMTFPF